MLGYTNASKMPRFIPEIVSWSSGTDAQIVAMVNAHYRGDINLYDYWNVGDTRSITLSAMSATYVGESHESQTVEMTLMDKTCKGFTLVNENVQPAFIVGMKNSLNEQGYMNATGTSVGGWQDCARRTWCNNIFREAFPSTIKNIFKQFTWKQGIGGTSSSGLNTTQDYFALPPEKAILGSVLNSFTDEGELYIQWSYYQTDSNRIKNVNGTSAYWWDSSPLLPYSIFSNFFCCTRHVGDGSAEAATGTYGISPFGCI